MAAATPTKQPRAPQDERSVVQCLACRKSFALDASRVTAANEGQSKGVISSLDADRGDGTRVHPQLFPHHHLYEESIKSSCVTPLSLIVSSAEETPMSVVVRPVAPVVSPQACIVPSVVYDYCHQMIADCSNTANIDLPLCARCWKATISEVELQLQRTVEEVDELCPFLNPGDDALAMVGKLAEEEKESEEEKALKGELALLDGQCVVLQAELNELEGKEQALAKEEDDTAGRVNDMLAEELLMRDEDETISAKTADAQARLERLSTFSLIAQVFVIDVTRPIGRINGHRVGKSSQEEVPPLEINCGCGYLAFLVDRLAHRNSVQFVRHRIHPLGVMSTIEVLQPKKVTYDFHLRGMFIWRTFGQAWVAFAACVKELAAHYETLLSQLPQKNAAGSEGAKADAAPSAASEPAPVCAIPHKIDAAKVGGLSVQHGDVADEVWTRAVKNIMEVLQWMISVQHLIDAARSEELTM